MLNTMLLCCTKNANILSLTVCRPIYRCALRNALNTLNKPTALCTCLFITLTGVIRAGVVNPWCYHLPRYRYNVSG